METKSAQASQAEIPDVVKPAALRPPLVEYYDRVYPTEKMVRWLGYGKGSVFANREWSFCKTVPQMDPSMKAKEIYTRYRCFNSAEQMKKELLSWKPDKIDIGAVYSMPPNVGRNCGPTFFPRERELVFDIDASDYDDVRACCQEKKICPHCWQLMAAGMQVLDFILERDFGFEHRLWVFSGRRGVHCWVSDEAARQMTDEERSSLARYVSVLEGGKSMKMNIDKDLEKGTLHPTLSDVLEDHIKPAFKRIFLDNPDSPNNLLRPTMTARVVEFIRSRAPSPALADQVHNVLKEANNAEAAWNRAVGLMGDKRWGKVSWLADSLRFAFVFPRLDEAVSQKRNHLLKAPFAVHPSTGKVCVPVDVQAATEFNPDTDPPVLSTLMQQIALGQAPSLPQMPLFDNFLSRLEIAEGRAGLAAAAKAPVAAP